MNVYKIGYYSMEESDYDYLIHNELYSEKQIKEFVEQATVITLNKLKADKKSHHYLHSYGDLHRQVVETLCKHFGFKEIELKAQWDCFGWGSIFSKKDWEGNRDQNLNDLTDKVLESGFSIRDDTFMQHEAKMRREIKHKEEE